MSGGGVERSLPTGSRLAAGRGAASCVTSPVRSPPSRVRCQWCHAATMYECVLVVHGRDHSSRLVGHARATDLRCVVVVSCTRSSAADDQQTTRAEQPHHHQHHVRGATTRPVRVRQVCSCRAGAGAVAVGGGGGPVHVVVASRRSSRSVRLRLAAARAALRSTALRVQGGTEEEDSKVDDVKHYMDGGEGDTAVSSR